MFESPMFVWIPMFFLFIPHLCGHTDQAEALESAAEAEQRDVTWWMMVDDGGWWEADYHHWNMVDELQPNMDDNQNLG